MSQRVRQTVQTDSPERQVEGADSIGIPAVILSQSTGTKATLSSADYTMLGVNIFS